MYSLFLYVVCMIPMLKDLLRLIADVYKIDEIEKGLTYSFHSVRRL